MGHLSKLKIRRLSHLFVGVFIITLAISVLFSLKLVEASGKLLAAVENKVSEQTKNISKVALPIDTPTTAPSPSTKPISNYTPKDNGPWGVAKQVGQETYTMKVGDDETMATPQQIFDALNNYRRQKGSTQLTWDDKLANFAQSRAETFQQAGKLDEHAGFNQYFSDQNNLKSMGYWAVGENSSFGFHLAGVHLIEWVFAGDKPHNDNQLDPTWTNVGVGVSGTGVDLIFAKNKI